MLVHCTNSIGASEPPTTGAKRPHGAASMHSPEKEKCRISGQQGSSEAKKAKTDSKSGNGNADESHHHKSNSRPSSSEKFHPQSFFAPGQLLPPTFPTAATAVAPKCAAGGNPFFPGLLPSQLQTFPPPGAFPGGMFPGSMHMPNPFLGPPPAAAPSSRCADPVCDGKCGAFGLNTAMMAAMAAAASNPATRACPSGPGCAQCLATAAMAANPMAMWLGSAAAAYNPYLAAAAAGLSSPPAASSTAGSAAISTATVSSTTISPKESAKSPGSGSALPSSMPFTCSWDSCGKRFATQSEFSAHVASHATAQTDSSSKATNNNNNNSNNNNNNNHLDRISPSTKSQNNRFHPYAKSALQAPNGAAIPPTSLAGHLPPPFSPFFPFPFYGMTPRIPPHP